MVALIPRKFNQNRYDGDVQEDEPAEAKFSDDEEEAAFLREQKRSGTAANAQVRCLVLFLTFAFLRVSIRFADVFSAI